MRASGAQTTPVTMTILSTRPIITGTRPEHGTACNNRSAPLSTLISLNMNKVEPSTPEECFLRHQDRNALAHG